MHNISVTLNTFPDFIIEPKGIISDAFLKRTIATFYDACLFISQVPYGRNKDKNELLSVLTENCGTCSTKHALLLNLALENSFKELKLVLVLFKMNGINTPKTAALLHSKQLNYMPEAHCYLKFKNHVIDCTHSNNTTVDISVDIIEELEIEPHQVNAGKIIIHKKHLADWLDKNPQIPYTLNELWEIREQCIDALSTIN